jgi:iron complex outermembrane receptor protein
MLLFRRLSVSFACLSVCLCAAAASAQTIVGTVRGEGRPLAGAEVRLLELDRTMRAGSNGEFTFRDIPAGVYTVFAGASGFASATQRVAVYGTARTAFDLSASAIPLKEVVVTASPFPRTVDQQYQSTASKSLIEFQNSSGMSFAEKISDLPSVAVRSNGSAPSRPVLRGLSDNEVLVLENGLRVGDLATFDPAHATPLEAISIQRVDVVRGPATVLYGPSTIGGVVNLITDVVPSVSDRPLAGIAAIEGNSVSNQTAGYFNNVFTSGSNAFRVSAGGSHSDDIRIPSGTYVDPETGTPFALDRMPQTFDHSGEFGGGYAFDGYRGGLGIGAKHYEMNYGIPGVPPNPDFVNVPPTTSRIAERRNTIETRNFFNVPSTLVQTVKLNASYNDYNHSEFPTAQDASGVSDPEETHFHKRDLNAVLQLQQNPRGRLNGVLGLWTNFEDMKIDGDEPLGPNSTTTGLAGYAYEEFIATPSSRLQAGLRYDYNKIQTNPDPNSADPAFQTLDVSRNANAVTGSLGLNRDLNRDLNLSLSVARSFRAPTVQELFANGLDAPSGTFTIGTPTLEPETGLGVDAGIRGNFATASFSLSPYLNYIHNYIYGFLRGDVIQGFPVRQFGMTNARLAGGEGTFDVQPRPRFAIRASADYVNAQDTKNDVPLPFTPPLRGLLRTTYRDRTYMGTIEWRGATKQTRLGEGDTPTAGYGIVNLGFGFRLPSRKVVHEIGIHCDNLFDRDYRDSLSVIKDFLPMPGRGFRLNYQLIY